MENTSFATRILIADDHPATREGLCALLEREEGFKVVAQAGDGMEAVALFREHQPHLTLLDLHMPRMDGLEAVAAIREEFPDALLVVMTSYDGDVRVAKALSLGVRSYILKTSHPKDVMSTLHRVLDGEVVLEKRLAAKVAASAAQDQLTPREISVIRLIAQGIPNRDIGLSLNVSEHTIKARIKNILAKLGANDRTHAVTLARERGFLDF
jgi:DNA-binding NarL/FixJ family response regulator